MLLGMVVCCGVGYYMFNAATDLVANEISSEFADDPMVVEHIGDITSSKSDLSSTISASQNEENVAVLVINLEGSKGNGQIRHRTDNKSGVVSATLVTEDGTEYPLSMDDAEEELEGLDLSELGIEDSLDAEGVSPAESSETPSAPELQQ